MKSDLWEIFDNGIVRCKSGNSMYRRPIATLPLFIHSARLKKLEGASHENATEVYVIARP